MSIDTAPASTLVDQIVNQVATLTGGFRSRASTADSQRSVPRESVDELLSAGLARMLVPTEHGGLDLRIRDAVDTATSVAYGCASTGWVSWLMMHVPHVIAMFPGEAQDTVWADGPDVMTVGTHLGMSVQLAPGGYRISGRAPFTSGVNHADWTYVGGMEPSEGGPPQLRYFLLRKGDYTVADTWDTVGMRGTGSNTVVVDDVFVSEAFTMAHKDAREGTGPGIALSDSRALRLPWVATGSLGFVGTMLGAAQAAYDDVVGSLSTKTTPGGGRAADSQALQVDVGHVSAKLEAAQTLLRGLADRADVGGEFTLTERAALTRTGTFVSSLVVEAIDKLLELSGTSGFGTSAVVQQSWRDIHFAAAHVSINRRDTWSRYGRVALGVDDGVVGLFY